MKIKLECPKCGLTANVQPDPTDPPRTARIVTCCDECADSNLVDYFDAEGRQIDLDGEPM